MHHSGLELINPFKVLERAGVQPGWWVADLGCGSIGHFVFPTAQMVGGEGRVYAVDIQKTVLKNIERIAKQEQAWNVQTVWSDIDVLNATRIPARSLDLTLVADNLYLSQNRAGLMAEAFRLTKHGGRLLIIEWKKEKTLLGPPVERRMSEEEARVAADHPELRFVEAFDAGDHHYGLLYERARSEQEARVVALSPLTDFSS